ncbi:hypothetical protein T09_8882 [Trichinella sp. T9]|nr:hypothetical protein T09_8882 [Trichinella sp. T9]
MDTRSQGCPIGNGCSGAGVGAGGFDCWHLSQVRQYSAMSFAIFGQYATDPSRANVLLTPK